MSNRFPTTYRLDETCAALNQRLSASRAITKAAVAAIAGYAVDRERLDQIAVQLRAEASDG